MEPVGLDDAERDEIRVQQLLNSTAITKSSPHAAGGAKARDTDTNYFDDKENSTMGSDHTAISGISSIIADETDDSFGRLLSTYAKDKQRVHSVLSSDVKVISKAKVGEREGLSAESSERRDTTYRPGDDTVASTNIPEPPVQIPRDWGRKGRHGTEWLERIVDTTGKGGLLNQSGEALRDPSDRLAAADNISLPSIEDEPTLLPSSKSQVGANPQTTSRKPSIERAQEPEEATLPAHESLLHQNRSTLLDTIREREIESLRDRAVTTSRLGEIKERTSKESLRSRTSSEGKPDYKRDRKGSIRSEGGSSQWGAGRETEGDGIKDSKDSASGALTPATKVCAEEGEQIPFTPITIFKSSHQYGRPSHRRQSGEGNDKKSDIDGCDSRDVLRRLARATSSSPKPIDDKQKTSDNTMTQPEPEDNSATPTLPKPPKLEEQTNGGGVGLVQPTPSFHVRGPGAWIDTPAPQPTNSDPGSPLSDYDVGNEISALGLGDFIRGPSSSPLYTRSGGLKGRPSKPDTIPRRRKSEPVIPTTRRQIEAENAKLEKEVLGNDADLSSLFDFYPDDADNTYAAIPAGSPTHIPDLPRPLTNAERERQREMLVYECLNRRLRTLQTEIAEAKRGIEGLESKIIQDVGTAWVKKPNAVGTSGDDYTLMIKIPSKGSIQLFARSLASDRKWRWLRWSLYAWCFFWLYAIIEFLF
jgi:hypothetical protein